MSDARNEWMAYLNTLGANPGNKNINDVAAQAQAYNPAPKQSPSRPVGTANLGRAMQVQNQQLQNMKKLGGKTQPFVDVGQTQPLPGQAGYAQLPVPQQPTVVLSPAFIKASNLRVRKGEIKPPPPPKESYQKYQERLAANQRRTFLQNTRAKYNYEQALENSRAAILNVGRNVFGNITDRLDQLPTPGNLRIPFLVLFILFFVLVPVNGHTRIGWLWLTFLGDTQISPNTNAYQPSSGVAGGGVAGGGGGPFT